MPNIIPEQVQPPANEAPLDASGQHTEAWSGFYQSVADRLRKLPAELTAAVSTGTTTNDNAAAGKIGEYLQTIVGTPGGMVSNVSANLATLALTAGDWSVSGEAWFNVTGGPANTLQAAISLSSAGLPGVGSGSRTIQGFAHLAGTHNLPLATARISLAAAANVYLVGYAFLGGGSVSGYGWIAARRMR